MYKESVNTHRVITILERNEVEFLDKLGKDSLFSTGHKLSYNEILKGLIDVAMQSGVSADKVSSLDEFKHKVLNQIRQIMQDEAKKTGGLK